MDMLQRQHEQHVQELNELLNAHHILLTQQLGHDSDAKLPPDIISCNSKAEETRHSLLDISAKIEEASERYEAEVENARIMLRSWLSSESDVNTRIETAISQIYLE